MNGMTPRKTTGSLLERAADIYDFGSHLRARQEGVRAEPEPILEPTLEQAMPPVAQPQVAPRARTRAPVAIDREMLAEKGLLVPGAPIGALVEEFRLVKRQLLQTARIVKNADGDKSRTILVCSARPGDGKTFCAINLAISLATERDVEVLLVDADFAKPDVMTRLDLADGPGLLDVLADPSIDVEACVVATDIPQLSLLPAGRKSITDTELLASKRTGEIIETLLAADPRRLVIFDSPPALAASPASVLASHAGQVMLVVRADHTSESDLREAVALLDRCDHIQLLLNAVSFVPGGRRFGSYYTQEDAK
jgi:protein-tyrosine kinase